MEALTALQWAKEGYVPNADAVGEERWTNCFHGQKAHTTKTTKFTKTLKLQRTCLELNEKSTKKHQIKGTRSEKKTWLIERT